MKKFIVALTITVTLAVFMMGNHAIAYCDKVWTFSPVSPTTDYFQEMKVRTDSDPVTAGENLLPGKQRVSLKIKPIPNFSMVLDLSIDINDDDGDNLWVGKTTVNLFGLLKITYTIFYAEYMDDGMWAFVRLAAYVHDFGSAGYLDALYGAVDLETNCN